MFECHNLRVSYGARHVLGRLDLRVPSGHRIALVGENGAGKSTLLRALAGRIEPDGGTLTRPPGRIGLLAQAPPWADTTTIGEVMQDAVAWATGLTKEVERAGAHLADHPDDADAHDRLAQAIARAEAADAWDAATHRAQIAAVFEIDPSSSVPFGMLSGGQRARVHLAHLFTGWPTALLLDEPTNHLDDALVGELTGMITSFDGPVVFASHDRQFIDDVATGVLDLDPDRGGARVVMGGWNEYRDVHRAARRQWENDFASHRAAVSTSREAIADAGRARRTPTATDNDKFIPHLGAQQAQSTKAARLRRTTDDLARLDAERVDKPPATLHLRAETLARHGGEGVVLAARSVAVKGRLTATDIQLSAGVRVLITGPNGAGKSTLLRVLDGSLTPTAGETLRRPGIRVGRLAQVPTTMRPRATPRQWYDAHAPEGAPALVSLGLIQPRDVDRPLGELSHGQRRRLDLALVLAHAPHVLLLDEPTDHLSLTVVEELEEAMRAAPGTIVVASHDRWLRQRFDGEEVWLGRDPRHS